MFWHECEKPAAEQNKRKKKKNRKVEKTWSSRGPLRPVIIQNEVEQSENSINNLECKNSQSIIQVD